VAPDPHGAAVLSAAPRQRRDRGRAPSCPPCLLLILMGTAVSSSRAHGGGPAAPTLAQGVRVEAGGSACDCCGGSACGATAAAFVYAAPPAPLLRHADRRESPPPSRRRAFDRERLVATAASVSAATCRLHLSFGPARPGPASAATAAGQLASPLNARRHRFRYGIIKSLMIGCGSE
jgi:hypothetical protein